MLIDTHCHLDDARFDADRDAVMQRAVEAGVEKLIIPAVHPDNFQAVRTLAHACPGGAYALGVHPLFLPQAEESTLDELDAALTSHRDDPRLVGDGEIE